VYDELISGDRVPNMDLGAICDGNPATRQLVESKYPAAAFLKKPERELSDAMDQQDMSQLLSGRLNLSQYYSSEIIESEAQWGVQHAGMLANFAADILDGTPLIAWGGGH
jgi:hypothetical protein